MATKNWASLVAVVMALALLASSGGGVLAQSQLNVNGTNNVPLGTCFDAAQDAMLLASRAVPPMVGSTLVAVPFNVFWNFFSQAQYWTQWNPLFGSMQTTTFQLCGPLDAVYTNSPAVQGAVFPANFTGPHHIVQKGLSADNRQGAYAWQFQLIDAQNNIFVYGRHTYTVTDVGNNMTQVDSFEKAAGSQVQQYSYAWTVALEESLQDGIEGVICLEKVYYRTGALNPTEVAATCGPKAPQMTFSLVIFVVSVAAAGVGSILLTTLIACLVCRCRSSNSDDDARLQPLMR